MDKGLDKLCITKPAPSLTSRSLRSFIGRSAWRRRRDAEAESVAPDTLFLDATVFSRLHEVTGGAGEHRAARLSLRYTLADAGRCVG